MRVPDKAEDRGAGCCGGRALTSPCRQLMQETKGSNRHGVSASVSKGGVTFSNATVRVAVICQLIAECMQPARSGQSGIQTAICRLGLAAKLWLPPMSVHASL